MHIREFTQAVGNPAKVFLFDLIIPSLPITTGIRCQSSQWPGVSSTDIDLFHMGQMAKFAGAVEYEHNWLTNIVESEVGDIYFALREWRALVHNQVTGISGDPAIYKRPITLNLLTSNGTVWASCTLHNAYPKIIDPVDLDKSANTEAYRWNVTFNYDWWS